MLSLGIIIVVFISVMLFFGQIKNFYSAKLSAHKQKEEIAKRIRIAREQLEVARAESIATELELEVQKEYDQSISTLLSEEKSNN